MSNYYLLPGNEISKLGLPGGHIKADKTAYQIKDDELAVIQPSLEYLVAVGKISNGIPAEPVTAPDPEKSAKRLELEAQAVELGIEFTDKTTQKVLSDLIEAKKARADLEKQAVELKLDFTAETTDDELRAAIEKALA